MPVQVFVRCPECHQGLQVRRQIITWPLLESIPYSVRQKPTRRALIVGCTYIGTSMALRNTGNDARDIAGLLESTGWFGGAVHKDINDSAENLRLLVDDTVGAGVATNEFLLPTQANIYAGFEWLVRDAQAGDEFFFFFSGHGVSDHQKGKDETDAFDEYLCPCDDVHPRLMISDNEMNAFLVRPLGVGVRLTAVIDACHSGSALDLPYTYNGSDMNDMVSVTPGHIRDRTSRGGQVFAISGCRDDEFSYDSSAFNAQNGALTGAVLAVLQNPAFNGITMDRLMDEVRRLLPHPQHPQLPQLSSALPVDPAAFVFLSKPTGFSDEQ